MTVGGIVLGVALAGGTLGIAAIGRLHRERAFYATVLAAIAVFYIVFAAQTSDVAAVARQAAIAGLFIGLAVAGFRTKRVLIAAGLACHALFDVAMGHLGGPAPVWWPGLCLGFDGVMAVAVLRFAPGRDAPR